MNKVFGVILYGIVAGLLLLWAGCSSDEPSTIISPQTAEIAGKPTPEKPPFDPVTLTCADADTDWIDVQVCAGLSGAPAGFTLQWMPYDVWEANNFVWDDALLEYCAGSFSGNAFNSRYRLLPDSCVMVRVGDLLFDNGASTDCPGPLHCGTNYVFRAFAHADSTHRRSDFSGSTAENLWFCSTDDCQPGGEGCTYTQGFWKNHGPEISGVCDCRSGNNENEWPETVMLYGLMLGTQPYNAGQLCSIFNTNTPVGGNGLLSLAHQLIAAKLNIANGADPTVIASTILSADSLIDGLIIPPWGTGYLAPSATSTFGTRLAWYNEGTIGPGHCR
jgi:hypothetical protein